MNEFFPGGFNSWYQYNRHTEKVAKIKELIEGIFVMVLLFGASLLAGV